MRRSVIASVAVFDRIEIMDFRLVTPAHLQVQVGGDLNLHGFRFARGRAILRTRNSRCNRESTANGALRSGAIEDNLARHPKM